ncbi:hypothetical protein [Dendronalium sp. ChiSLP03b]
MDFINLKSAVFEQLMLSVVKDALRTAAFIISKTDNYNHAVDL